MTSWATDKIVRLFTNEEFAAHERALAFPLEGDPTLDAPALDDDPEAA